MIFFISSVALTFINWKFFIHWPYCPIYLTCMVWALSIDKFLSIDLDHFAAWLFDPYYLTFIHWHIFYRSSFYSKFADLYCCLNFIHEHYWLQYFLSIDLDLFAAWSFWLELLSLVLIRIDWTNKGCSRLSTLVCVLILVVCYS